VYAFAIDNFNRPQEEVDTLMNLARDSLAEICAEG
jgi:ditrans,polycis-polyprenyl diphosphate synthase